MALTKFQALQAKDLFSFLISVPSSVTTGGVITWGSGTELAIASTGTGDWKAVEWDVTPNDVMLMPGDGAVENNQTEYESFNLVIRQLKIKHYLTTLETMAFANDFFRVDVVYGVGTTKQRFVFVGKRGPLRETLQQGENLAELTLKPMAYAPWFGASSGTPPI